MQPQQSVRHSADRRRGPRRAWLVILAVVMVAALPVSERWGTVRVAAAQTSDEVAEEILRVQRRADETAGQWTAGRDRAEDLQTELDEARRELQTAERRYAALDSALTVIAVGRFTGANNPTNIFFADNPDAEMQRATLTEVLQNAGNDNLDDADELRADLRGKEQRVTRLVAENQRTVRALGESAQRLERQLAQLSRLRDRLRDDEVRRAYEAKVAAARQAAAKAAARAAAKAATQTTPPTQPRGGGTNRPARFRPTASSTVPARPTVPPATVPRATVPRATIPTPRPTTPRPTTPRPTTPRPTTPRPTTPRPTTPRPTVPRPTTPPTRPRPPATIPPKPKRPAPPPVARGWQCPVDGPTAFSDTWGAPRSGGRRHQGVDMISPSGTRVVAVVGGYAQMKTNRLGGNVIWLNGSDGNRYYYGHLSSWAGGSRQVRAGELIGYVGSTGNAPIPHLHFEYHPGGAGAVNPYPIVRANC